MSENATLVKNQFFQSLSAQHLYISLPYATYLCVTHTMYWTWQEYTYFMDDTLPRVFVVFFQHVECLYTEYLIQNGHMSEDDARKKFCQIVKAVDYCHQHSIVHRDLKVSLYYESVYVCKQTLCCTYTCMD